MVAISLTNIVKLDGFGNFELWQRSVKDVFLHKGLMKALSGKQFEGMNAKYWKDSKTRAMLTVRMCLANEVMYHVMDEESLIAIWLKLESQYMSKSLTNKLLLKNKLYCLKMEERSALDQHMCLIKSLVILIELM